jgi:hypothetical protein
MNEIREIGSAFSRWQELSNAYEIGIEALRQRQLGAGTALMVISREHQTCEGAKLEARTLSFRE